MLAAFKFFIFLALSLLVTPAWANGCKTAEGREAYKFGIHIQSLIRNKDAAGLYKLVDGELDVGPQRAHALSTHFEQVFHRDWIASALSMKPPCYEFGWRGYLLGEAGAVRYRKVDGQMRIIGFYGYSEAPKQTQIWSFNGQKILPKCFEFEWLSGDNFSEFSSRYKVPRKGLQEFPGQFLGKEITEFRPFKPSWCEDESCENITLFQNLADCAPKGTNYQADDGYISAPLIDEDGTKMGEVNYRLIKRLSKNQCQALVPFLNSPCLDAHLIVHRATGGSMSFPQSGIFGLFDLQDIGISVVPLVYFENKNIGLNFLDTLSAN